jgi:hypothetical protein
MGCRAVGVVAEEPAAFHPDQYPATAERHVSEPPLVAAMDTSGRTSAFPAQGVHGTRVNPERHLRCGHFHVVDDGGCEVREEYFKPRLITPEP